MDNGGKSDRDFDDLDIYSYIYTYDLDIYSYICIYMDTHDYSLWELAHMGEELLSFICQLRAS